MQSRSRAWKTSVTTQKGHSQKTTKKKSPFFCFLKLVSLCRERGALTSTSIRAELMREMRKKRLVCFMVCVLFSLVRWQNLQLLFLSFASRRRRINPWHDAKKKGGKTSRVEFRAYLFTRTRPCNKKDGQSRSLIALRVSLYIGLVNFFFFLTRVVIYLYTPQINNHVVVPFFIFLYFSSSCWNHSSFLLWRGNWTIELDLLMTDKNKQIIIVASVLNLLFWNVWPSVYSVTVLFLSPTKKKREEK